MENNPFDAYTAEYEAWFKENEIVFQSELLALKQVIPVDKTGLEIGIGSGIFAEKLNIQYGIDPSEKMLQLAQNRHLTVTRGVAENLPYNNNSFDFAVFITSLCFIDDPEKALNEAHRVIKKNGDLIIAFIDKDSAFGKSVEQNKSNSHFFRNARLFSADEISSLMIHCHFEITEIFQTLCKNNPETPEIPIKGYGKGGFVVLKGTKK